MIKRIRIFNIIVSGTIGIDVLNKSKFMTKHDNVQNNFKVMIYLLVADSNVYIRLITKTNKLYH